MAKLDKQAIQLTIEKLNGKSFDNPIRLGWSIEAQLRGYFDDKKIDVTYSPNLKEFRVYANYGLAGHISFIKKRNIYNNLTYKEVA